MKLAFIHHQLALSGGMETYFLELIKTATQAGHAIDVFVMKQDPKIILPDEVQVHVIPSRIYPRFLRKYHFALKLKKRLLSRHYDTVISTTRSFSQDILITGGTHRGYMRALGRHTLADYLESYLESKAYHRAKKIIAHSPALQSELIDLYGISPEKITMLYPPVDVRAFQYQKKNPTSQPLRLLFASTSHKRKGGFLLLDALKKLPPEDFELTVVGKPFKQARQMPQVKCLGYVKNITDYYHQADWLVLPSYFEPFGLVVVQALECGTPVILSKQVGAAALLGPDEGLILENQNACALAQCLQDAKKKQCSIQPGFAVRHGLTLEAHFEAVLACH